MPVESRRRVHHLRQWQQRIVQLILLFSVAAAVSLVWSLVEPKEPALWTGTIQTEAIDFSPDTPNSETNGQASASRSSEPRNSEPRTAEPRTSESQSNLPGSATATARAPRPSDSVQIPVYLVGAVHRPGVYIVSKGVYLYELVELAGGLTAEAAATTINLAMRISENQMIRIPTQVEAEQEDGLSAVPGAGLSAPSPGAININRATQADLEKLPGVGPATAAAIIADRTKNGPFRKPEELMRVPGIKESRYVLMEALITVG